MGEQELDKNVKPEELIQAEKKFEEGEFDKALKLLNIFDKKRGIHYYDKLSCYHLKGQLLIWQGNYEEAIKISEEMYKFSQLYDSKLKSIDALILLSHIHTYSYEDDKALNIIEQAEKLLKKISQESSKIFLGREAHLIYCKGLIFAHKGDLVRALEYLERSLTLREELGNKQEISQSLWTIARVFSYNGKFDRAFDILERSLPVATESNSLFYVGVILNTIATIEFWEGKLNRGLANYEKSLTIFKKINNKLIISGLFNNISGIYYQKGELDRALDYLDQGLALVEDLKIGRLKTNILDTAIRIALEINDVKRVQEYFQELEEINDQEDNEEINLIHLYNKALLLKSSSLKSDQIRAREILTKIVEKKIPFLFEIEVRSLLDLCDILLTEFHDTSNLELLDQIQLYINQIINIAKNQKLYWLLVESYLIDIKFDLITLDLKKAQKTLTEAQEIAEKYSMNQLVKRISIEQKSLFKQRNKWLKLRDSDIKIVELANLIPLKEQINYMLKKREMFKGFNI
ncbi:MAG: tetratricopeptide repeat protein [Candidatus Thorarchaeota archaeon]